MKSKVEMPTYIADIHTHVLPAIDDGSKSMEETLAMLKIAAEEGITHMIATPHYKVGRGSADRETVRKLVDQVQAKLEEAGLNIRLYPGHEVFYNSELADRFNNGRISTLNDTKYVLVEFSPMDTYRYIRNGLDEVIGMGYKPIIAHVERYECMLKNPENVEGLRALGVGIQVNASSITGEVGWKVKKFVHGLLEDGLVDYVGTDAHSASDKRKPFIHKCVSALYKKYDSAYVDNVLYNNAEQNIFKVNTGMEI